MKCKEFLDGLDDFLRSVRETDGAFERNMKKIELEDDTFCGWLGIWLAWHELSSVRDCKRHYWQDEYD